MARLILLLMLFAALTLAVIAAVAAWRMFTAPVPAPLPSVKEEGMPPAIRKTAYILLFLLLAGLTSGYLGPA